MTGARVERLRAALLGAGLDALIVDGAASLRYLTGYTGTNGLALVGAAGGDRFLTDFRYATQVGEQIAPTFEVEIVTGELLDTLARRLEGRVGFDDATMSVRRHQRLGELAPASVELVAAAGHPERLRAVKDEQEIVAIAAAAALVDGIYAWLCERGLGGRTERDVAVALEHEMRMRGASAPSFPSIVASGAHGALPHAWPRDEPPIATGSLVTIDIGAVCEGYCSDCTRTLAVGEPGAHAREVYELVAAAQLAGLEAVAPGVSGRDADARARAVIERAGHGEHFGHSLGHGVGLEIHEAPRLSRTGGDAPLEAGNVVTVEPGVYIPGELGVRIEDLVVVREGAAEILSAFTKELLAIE